MANKRRILVSVTLLIAILGFASWLILSQPSEPVYQGKPLSYWCEQYAANNSPNSNIKLEKQAEIAIQTIGADAVPTLLRMLRAKDSKLKFKLFQLASKQHIISIKWKPAQLRHDEAILGFICLGPLASSAVPALVEIYHERRWVSYSDPDNGDFRGILQIFAVMGPAATGAVPQFVHDTTDPNPNIRWTAVWTLGNIHAKPDLAVPALTKSLRDPTEIIRAIAAFSLAAFGSDAKSAVPELVKALADPSFPDRDGVAAALKKIDPEAAAKAGVK